MAERTLRVCALYPDLMNIYADRGNLLLLERRCAWRGIGFEVVAAGLGEGIDPDAHDLFYIGGAQDRDQALCAQDMVDTKRDALHAAADAGRVVLAVCGGYQLLGHHYELGDERIPGVGLVDLHTVREDGPRLIGNVAIEVRLPGLAGPRVLAGFENHGGRTHLGAGAQPLGRVLKGHGNTGASGFEGVLRDHVIGTYLHGPLLPKNAWFADWLIATALGLDEPLAALEDALEDAAHADARRVAGLARTSYLPRHGGVRRRPRAFPTRSVDFGSRNNPLATIGDFLPRGNSSVNVSQHRPARGAVVAPAGGHPRVPQRLQALRGVGRAGDPGPELRGPGRRHLRPRRALGLRQDDGDAPGQPHDRDDQRRHPARRRVGPHPHARRAAPRDRLRDPADRPVPAPDDRREHRHRPAPARLAARARFARASTSCSSSSASIPPRRATATPRSSPAASASASAWPAPWPPTRR